MRFKEYNEVAEPIELPINGKVYTLPFISIDGGTKLLDAFDPESDTNIPDEEFFRIVLGDLLDELRKDHVAPSVIAIVASVGVARWKSNTATAEVLWETGADPKVIQERTDAAKNRAQRRLTSTTTDAATTTRKAASTTGTSRSRKASSRKP